MLCQDGVVLAADTQESWSDGLKCSAGKIYARFDEPIPGKCSIACTGSGPAHELESISQQIMAFSDQDRNPAEFEKYLAKAIGGFHKQHVLPLAGTPEVPNVSLIIAQRTYYSALWSAENGLVRRVPLFACAGAGASVCKALIDRYYAGKLDLETAVLLSLYVLFVVKQDVQYCGHESDVLAFGRGKARGISRDDARALEDLFREYQRTEADIFGFIAGNPYGHADSVQGVEALRAKVKPLLSQALRDCDP